MRENPGLCSVLHKDVSSEVGVHQADHQEVFIASEASRVESATTKGFVTGERREEAANSEEFGPGGKKRAKRAA